MSVQVRWYRLLTPTLEGHVSAEIAYLAIQSVKPITADIDLH